MLELPPEFLKKDGQNAFVVLPYEEFVEIQDRLVDAEDLLELRRAKAENQGEVPVPLEEVRRRFGLD